MYLLTKYIKKLPLGSSGTSVLYIGCMVPMWGGAVRLSYV